MAAKRPARRRPPARWLYRARRGVGVNDRLRTSNPYIFAVGDTCSRLMKSIAKAPLLAASFWSLILLPIGTVVPSSTLASS